MLFSCAWKFEVKALAEEKVTNGHNMEVVQSSQNDVEKERKTVIREVQRKGTG